MITNEVKMISLFCPSCNARMQVAETAIGKRGRCRSCHHVFKIAAPIKGTGRRPEASPLALSLPVRAEMLGTGSPVGRTLQANLGVQPLGDTDRPLPAVRPLNVGQYRHEKERVYFIIATVISVLGWLVASPFVVLGAVFAAPFILIMLLLSWIMGQLFRARILGGSVHVSREQTPEIHEMARAISARLGLRRIPEIFLLNSQGAMNALAMRFLGKRYVFLYSSLVDLMLSERRLDELKTILAHELAHHAAGHVSAWKSALLKPASLVPFLGAAYARACELTADRISLVVVEHFQASQRSLAWLACGSARLAPDLSLEAFRRQEDQIPWLLGFMNDLYSSQPRLTLRACELQRYAVRVSNGRATNLV